MASKRANGEGTILKYIRNGKQIGWRASITIGYNDKIMVSKLENNLLEKLKMMLKKN